MRELCVDEFKFVSGGDGSSTVTVTGSRPPPIYVEGGNGIIDSSPVDDTVPEAQSDQYADVGVEVPLTLNAATIGERMSKHISITGAVARQAAEWPERYAKNTMPMTNVKFAFGLGYNMGMPGVFNLQAADGGVKDGGHVYILDYYQDGNPDTPIWVDKNGNVWVDTDLNGSFETPVDAGVSVVSEYDDGANAFG